MIRLFLFLIFLILVGNIFLLNFFFVSQRNDLLELRDKVSELKQKPASQSFPTGSTDLVNSQLSCPQSCVTAINTAISTIKPSAPLIAPVVQNTTVNQKGEYFIPLGTGSVGPTADWTNMTSAQAVFDSANYPSIKMAYFEAFLHTVSGGEVHARLFDATTPAVFFNSDVKSTAESSEFLSVPISLKSGQKTYRVQMYSKVANGYLDQARIRIVTQ